MKLKKLKYVLLLLCVVVSLSCEKALGPDAVESTKQLTGSWQITKITQNGADLTSLLDLTKFRLTFSGNNYTMTNDLPFIVRGNGSYAFNDPQYPFAVSFTPTGGQPVKTDILYPITGGQRQIIISFNLGCDKNSYQYTLKPVN